MILDVGDLNTGDLNLFFLFYTMIQLIIPLIPHYKKILELSILKRTKSPLHPLQKVLFAKRLTISQHTGLKGSTQLFVLEQ